ncbi:metallophosphatase family protein [Natroniella sulfidigena]|uniref:metallophosphoesterase family protein n=1 Tax=Natroniella sulfidigena TaxID=723921 RepID=UPI00200B1ACC|nr:metallophosphoesterase family protein [Natroniella sulfidigena]MCK8816428.1 metallophosphatase family protein [Natroniella sulfidigena]
MRIAVISDIHSNIDALNQVLEDIKRRDIEEVFCLGDLVGYNPFPNQVIERIKEEGIKTVQGNYDEAIANSRIFCGCDYKNEKAKRIGTSSIQFTNQEISEQNREFLKELPQQLEVKIGGLKALLVHGSPRQLTEYLYADSQELEEVVEELEGDLLLCGHTHRPYHQLISKKHIINVGSVGKPKDGNPNAVYTIVEVAQGKVKRELIELSYPVEKVAAKIKETDLADESIELLELGRA